MLAAPFAAQNKNEFRAAGVECASELTRNEPTHPFLRTLEQRAVESTQTEQSFLAAFS
jgi:hypothetical protein